VSGVLLKLACVCCAVFPAKATARKSLPGAAAFLFGAVRELLKGGGEERMPGALAAEDV